jgi:hypothetical protein
LIEEYEKKNSHRLANEERQQVCCDENTPCVPREDEKITNSNDKKMMIVDASNYDYNNNYVDSHKGENPHSKNIIEEIDREQQILLKDNKETIINFILSNKDSVKIGDLNYEPIYKCYRQKGNCHICNTITNIICKNCNNYRNKEVWLCTNHWKQHKIENHV